MLKLDLPGVGPSPLFQMVPYAPERKSQPRMSSIPSISQVKAVLWNDKIVFQGVIQYVLVIGRPLITGPDIDKAQRKIARCQNIGGDVGVAVTPAPFGFFSPDCRPDVGAIKGTNAVVKVWGEFGVPQDP